MGLTTSAPQRRASDWPVVATDSAEPGTTPSPSLPNQAEAAGRKFDGGKLRWSLFPAGTLNEVLKVLEFGAVKYAVANWKVVPQARTRYYDALLRHVDAWWQGEKKDPETGYHHLSHAVCCALFLIWLDWSKDENPSTQDSAPQGSGNDKPANKV